MNGVREMEAGRTTNHAPRRVAAQLLCLFAWLMLTATSVRAQSAAAGPAAASSQGESGARPAEGGGAASGESATAPPRQSDPASQRRTRPAPSVTPSEKILADSVVSFPVDI